MKLFEYEAKQILSSHGISTPKGGLAREAKETSRITSDLKPPFAVKAQVRVSGRGKAGGIVFAASIAEAEKAVERLFKTRVKGEPVTSVWVEERQQVEAELYFGITIDRASRSYVAIASAAGGVEIEEAAADKPEELVRFCISPHQGFRSFHARQLARKIGYSGSKMSRLARNFETLYRVGLSYDAELIEMNPIVETSNGNFVAIDARIIIDDNALFRHPEYQRRLLEEQAGISQQEHEAIKNDLAYVKLDGEIGVIGNGAGLVMATLDTIQLYGGKPANFLDVGGGATSEKVKAAVKIVLSDESVKALFINILGGITRCDEVASGILKAKDDIGTTKPTVIRLVGTNEGEGRRMLKKEGIHVMDSMEEASQKAVELSRKTG